MTKQDIRERQGSRSLLQIALDVHMANEGSYDVDPKVTAEDVKLLADALAIWTPCGSQFEESVYCLLQVAVEEYRQLH